MFLYHNRIDLELKTEKSLGNPPNTFKVNNILLTNQIEQEMKREIRKFVEMNDTKTYEMSLRQCSEGNV